METTLETSDPTSFVETPESIPPTREALTEAFRLSKEILEEIELNQVPLTNIALKASRLARLLNDWNFQKIMQYEAAGYPGKADGIPSDIWALGGIAQRHFEDTDPTTKKAREQMYKESISTLEATIRASEASLTAAQDPNVSLTSANPMQVVHAPSGNFYERNNIRSQVQLATSRLSSRRNFIYQYASEKLYELKFSGIASDVFATIRGRVDSRIGSLVPGSIQQFSAIYDYLKSENPENWANAVHSCRRILQSVADSVFPPSETPRTTQRGGKNIEIKLGKDHYINRLIAFVEDSSSSDRFQEIVGSHISFLGDRLDSIFKAAQKGSHATVSKEEADRYVIYTYMIVGDILVLRDASTSVKTPPVVR